MQKGANLFLGGLGWNFQFFGNDKISLAVELWWYVVEKSLSDNSLTIEGVALCDWQRAENFGGVQKKYTTYSKGGLKIGIVADDEV